MSIEQRQVVAVDQEQFRKALGQLPDDKPILMLNMLRFKEQADYGQNSENPCTGEEAYQRYAAGVFPILQETGGKMTWTADAHASLLAPKGEQWDRVFTVRYPNKAAFIATVSHPNYPAAAVHRTAALADSRLIGLESQE